MDSMRILDKAVEECASAGYSVGNADLTILAEGPKMAPYLDAIKNSLAKPMKISPSEIGLKATTNEGLGTIGRGEGIASFAVCLLVKDVED